MMQLKMNKITCLLLLALLSAGCDKKNDRPPPPSVTVAKPVISQITPYLIETGNTVAYNSVDLVARVSGYLDSYNFKDGSVVKKGDLLFVIQPQPYIDDVIEAKATLESNIAAFTYDEQEYKRQEKMYKKHATSLAELQQWLATRDEAAAAVKSATASLNSAEITYSYTHVLSPIDGRIGRHLIDPGNLVGNGEATELASIQQIDPIYVYFNVNELDLLEIRKLARKAEFKSSQINEIPIEVALQNEKGFPHKGHLDFVATELEASTGTIQLRGILHNKNLKLLPGLFAKVRIALAKPASQLTIPDTAIMADQIGPYVFTLGADNKVHQVHVTTGSTENGRTVVVKGLKAEDTVIVEGIQNATPGGEVTPTETTSA